MSRSIDFDDYVTSLRNFVGATALADGIAFSDRAGGNLSRPFYPDGIAGRPHGPLSKPPGEWSPFSTGLQLDLSFNSIFTHVAFLLGLSGTDTGSDCANAPGAGDVRRAANGLQIFPGSVPVFKGSTLVGGIGVSGDGVDQDDMISFLAVHNASGVNNAPSNIRADNLTPQGVRLRYINCPQAPFNNSNVQNACQGK